MGSFTLRHLTYTDHRRCQITESQSKFDSFRDDELKHNLLQFLDIWNEDGVTAEPDDELDFA